MFDYDIIKSFNELELLLYNYITQNRDKVIYMTIRELASEIHVSTTTILRFCRKLGCAGFSEFKIKLKHDIDTENTGKVRDDVSVIIDYFSRIKNSDLEDRIEKASDLIGNSESLGFIGIGMSGSLCRYAYWYFAALGKSSFLITEPYIKINGSDFKKSVFIVVSVSGETPDTIEHLNRLKNDSNKIISITNSANCTIARLSDLNIPYYTNREHLDSDVNIDISSQVPVMYILESIARKLHNKYLLN